MCSSRFDDIKGLIRLCQILNFDVNFLSISSNIVHRPLEYLSIDTISRTNFARFVSIARKDECGGILKKIGDVYEDLTNISTPLQMYLKEKFYPKQLEHCKLFSDISVQLDRFSDAKSNDRSIPFSLMFFDSRTELMKWK